MTDTTTPLPAEKPVKRKETPLEMLGSVAFMVLIALLFRSLAFEPFHIPSGSMLSTLYKGDYIFVSKYAYGYSRYSFPLSPNLFEGRILATPPKRGDVVVFWIPSIEQNYIKRIVGLPGDTIQMRHGRLFINGAMVEQTRQGDVSVPDDTSGEPHSEARYEEVLPGGKHHIVLDDYPNGPADNTKLYTVPEGHYFMMGDNRDHSQDSRFEDPVGYVPFENILGRAELIAFSWKGTAGHWLKWIE